MMFDGSIPRVRLGRLWLGLALFSCALLVAPDAAKAEPEMKLTICHTAGNGKRIELSVDQEGADDHLANHALDEPGRCRAYCDETADCSVDHACIDGACIPIAPCPESEQDIIDTISDGGGVFGCDQPTEVTTTSEIVINDNVLLGGLENLTITGDGTHRILRVSEGAQAELIGMTISGGGGVDYGGGVLVEGPTTFNDVTFSDNEAALGGGALATGTGSAVALASAEGVEIEALPPGYEVWVYNSQLLNNRTTQSDGGAVYVDGKKVILYNCEVSENKAQNNGGAFYVTSTGALVLRGTGVRYNEALNGSGGGIYTLGGDVSVEGYNDGSGTLKASILAFNTSSCLGGLYTCGGGGGIAAIRGNVKVSDSHIAVNQAGYGGGGIMFRTNTLALVHLTIERSSVGWNTACGERSSYGAGIWFSGDFNTAATLEITDSIVSGNGGCGFYADGIHQSGGTVDMVNTTVSSHQGVGVRASTAGDYLPNRTTLTGCTVSRNNGGGVRFPAGAYDPPRYEQSMLTVVNTTVSDNNGFGLAVSGDFPGVATVINSTISDNSGYNFVQSNDEVITTIRNTLLRELEPPTRPSCALSSGSVITSGGYNIESPGNSCGFDQATDQVDVSGDALNLGPLQDNGGPTETRALLPGSVAINVIPEAQCLDADGQPLTTDQRGEKRPQPEGGRCDVGAVEALPIPVGLFVGDYAGQVCAGGLCEPVNGSFELSVIIESVENGTGNGTFLGPVLGDLEGTMEVSSPMNFCFTAPICFGPPVYVCLQPFCEDFGNECPTEFADPPGVKLTFEGDGTTITTTEGASLIGDTLGFSTIVECEQYVCPDCSILGSGTAEMTVNITGGTGDFQGASGEILFSGVALANN